MLVDSARARPMAVKTVCVALATLALAGAASGSTAAVAGCARCAGVSGSDACLSVLDRALTEASTGDRLGVLEEVFAGDTCEELGDDHCLVQL